MKKTRILLLTIVFLVTVLFAGAAQKVQEADPHWKEVFREEFSALAREGNISDTTVKMFSDLSTESLRVLDPGEAAEQMYRLAREIDLSLRRGRPRTKLAAELHRRLSNKTGVGAEAVEETTERIRKKKRDQGMDQIKRGFRENNTPRGPSASSNAAGRHDTPPGKPDIPFNR